MKPIVTIWTTSQFPFDQRLRRIASALKSAGWNVTVWDRKTADNARGKIDVAPSTGPSFYLAYNRAIARNVSKTTSELIYAADIDVMPGLMWGLGKYKRHKLILDLHEWFPEVVELDRKPIKKAIWRIIESQSVAFADKVITVNRSLQQILEAKYNKKISVVQNVPVLTELPEVNIDKRLNNKVLYYQGAINEGRGLEDAIRSLHHLPGWTFWLVGDGDITERLLNLAVEEGLSERVDFKGRQPPEVLQVLAAQATVGLNLLEGRSRSYYYSLANKYFDYIHALLPGLHMNFPEYRALMGIYPTGRMLEELSPMGIGKHVQEMVKNPEQYVAMMDQCSAARSKYHWQEESKKLLAILKDG